MAKLTYSPEIKDPEAGYCEPVIIDYEGVDDIIPMHPHPFGHRLLVTLGTIDLTIGDEVMRLQAPHQAWIPKGVPHGMRSVTPVAQSICLIPGKHV